jgi:hypothetical protein
VSHDDFRSMRVIVETNKESKLKMHFIKIQRADISASVMLTMGTASLSRELGGSESGRDDSARVLAIFRTPA